MYNILYTHNNCAISLLQDIPIHSSGCTVFLQQSVILIFPHPPSPRVLAPFPQRPQLFPAFRGLSSADKSCLMPNATETFQVQWCWGQDLSWLRLGRWLESASAKCIIIITLHVRGCKHACYCTLSRFKLTSVSADPSNWESNAAVAASCICRSVSLLYRFISSSSWSMVADTVAQR